jgi:hypothetical protein
MRMLSPFENNQLNLSGKYFQASKQCEFLLRVRKVAWLLLLTFLPINLVYAQNPGGPQVNQQLNESVPPAVLPASGNMPAFSPTGLPPILAPWKTGPVLPPSNLPSEPPFPINGNGKNGVKDSFGLSRKLPPGNLADLKARMEQAESGDSRDAVMAPLKSVINFEAEMKVDRDEVKLDGLRGISVEVKNNTDRTLIFHGNQASATISGKTVVCVSKTELERVMNPMLSGKHRVKSDFINSVVGLSTIGAVPAAKGIVEQSKPVLERYGRDERRRQAESARFGDRVVWPGSSTRGIMYFDVDEPLSGAAIQVPVSSLYDTSDQASIVNTD